jgi:hypothetical protein
MHLLRAYASILRQIPSHASRAASGAEVLRLALALVACGLVPAGAAALALAAACVAC